MYRIAAALAVLMLFAACHDDGVGMEWGAGLDPSVSGQTQMEEITVEWLGTDTAIHKEKTVTVDAGRGISVKIEVIGTEGTVTDSCSGAAEMTEEDYQAVVTQVMAADLPNYEPPAEGDEDCEVVDGLRGMVITYSYTGQAEGASEEEGEVEDAEDVEGVEITKDAEETENTEETEDTVGISEVSFETGKCAMDNKIEAIATVVGGLAENYITDCTDEIVVDGEDDDDDADPTTDTDNDCIPDDVEVANGTDPNSSDTDGDGLADGWISLTGLGEDLNCNGTVDKDADGQVMETDPSKADSDGDGQNDYDEMTCGGTFGLSNIFIANDATKQCDPGAAE